MADADADVDFIKYGPVVEVSLPVAASTTIYKGQLVAEDAGGDMVHAGDDAGANYCFLAAEACDNSAGADAAKSVKCIVSGMVSGSISTALTKASVGALVYAVDSSTVTDAGTATNDVAVGRLVGFDDNGAPRILIGV